EEAALLLGPGGTRIIITGNESKSFAASSSLPGLTVLLSQSMSLMGQDRTRQPKLETVPRDAGIKSGQSVGIVGWKYLEAEEWDDDHPGFLVPHHMVVILARLVGSIEGLSDVSSCLMHPETGGRSVVDADQIAAFEWASARASKSVWNLLLSARPG